MARLNFLIRHQLIVTDINGAAVTGLVLGGFTKTFKRWDGVTLTDASETVYLTEIGGGSYWVSYTPTAGVGIYILTLTHATHILSRSVFEDEVLATYEIIDAGTYLTTRANVRAILSIPAMDSSKDIAIDMLIAQVSALVEGYCGRTLLSASVTEYQDGNSTAMLVLKEYPVTAVASVHESTDAPRVYDSTTLLSTNDYIFSEEGLLYRSDGSRWSRGFRTVKVVYTAGYASNSREIQEIESAVHQIIMAKLYKSSVGGGPLYHLTAMNIGEGAVQGIRFDDIPEDAKRTLDRFRDQRVS